MSSTKYHYNRHFFKEPIKSGGYSIYQLGELFANESTDFDEHIQVCDEISCVLSGKGAFYSNGKKYEIGAGDCFLSFKDETHFIESSAGNPLRFYFCGFDAARENEKKLEAALRELDRPLIHCPAAEKLMADMISETWMVRQFGEDMLCAKLGQLIITLLRAASSGGADNRDEAPLSYQIENYLNTHISEIDALTRLEKTFNYNYSVLSAAFVDSTGMTIGKYFLKARMDYAAALLRDGKSVTEVADILGYSSIHPFSRAYKRHFGHAPTK